MISAPATGCCCSNCCSNVSAGGQVEQPSEVNSSTTTGWRAASVAGVCAFALTAKGKHMKSSANDVVIFVIFVAAPEECLIAFTSFTSFIANRVDYPSTTKV